MKPKTLLYFKVRTLGFMFACTGACCACGIENSFTPHGRATASQGDGASNSEDATVASIGLPIPDDRSLPPCDATHANVLAHITATDTYRVCVLSSWKEIAVALSSNQDG